MPDHTTAPSPPINAAFFGLAIVGSLAMVALGLYAISVPGDAARAYGVPLTPDATAAWIGTTGIRDLTVGLLGVVFALLRDRRALGVLVLTGTVIPIGDGLVVFTHNPEPMPYALIHWGSAVACLVFGWLLLRQRRV